MLYHPMKGGALPGHIFHQFLTAQHIDCPLYVVRKKS
jgi:hypothetical protein